MSHPEVSLADAVRAAVEGSGLTIEQISADTRIRSTLIRDLQDGRTASSGGDVYARGHLRAIAHTTGADPAPMLEALARESGVPQPEPAQRETVPLTGLRAGSLAVPMARAPERRGPHWGLAVGLAAVLLVVVLAVGNLRGDSGGGGGSALPSGQPSVSASAPATPTSPAASVPPVGPDAVASLPATSGAALRVRVIGGSSWVLVRSGETKVFEGVLGDGTVKDFTDPAGLQVKVGNAGAVSLICGGKDVPAGGSGQVKTFTCAPTGLAPV